MLNGYIYQSANSVTDEEMLGRRAELFTRRGGHYYRHWESSTSVGGEGGAKRTASWRRSSCRRCRSSRTKPSSPRLGASARATSSSSPTIACSRPSTGSSSTTSSSSTSATGRTSSSTSSAGRPSRTSRTRRSRRWSRASTSSSCARTKSSSASPGSRSSSVLPEPSKARATRRRSGPLLAELEPGERWLADFDETKDPWFYFSNGTGLYHHHRSWIDDTRLPIAAIGAYISAARGRRGRLAPARRRPCRARTGHRRPPLAALRGQRARLRREPGARSHRLPVHRGPQLLHRAPLLHALLEQGARVRCAARARTDSWPSRRTSSTCDTARYARRSKSSA